MDADDFHEVYKLLRGSRSATVVLDARALFVEGKTIEALARMTEAREQFADSRSRVLRQDVTKQVDPKAKDAERQIKKLQRKKEKVEETLEAFDELIPDLERLAIREKKKREKQEAGADSSELDIGEESGEEIAVDAVAERDDVAEIDAVAETVAARCDDVSKEFIDAFTSSSGDDRLNVISQRFGFREVETDDDIHGNALYLIQTAKSSFLVSTPAADKMDESVPVVSVVDDRPIKPFTRKAFLRLGKRRKMVLLTTSERSNAEASEGEGSDEIDQPNQSGEVAAPDQQPEQSILDKGSFSQLLTSAQRSGLVPGADQIAHVRDREFRMGKYDLAFQAIDSLFSRFSASSAQRLQRLSREDADIASGKIKISAQELLAKRTRDRTESQEVDRAKRRFQVVLEGLRVLMQSD